MPITPAMVEARLTVRKSSLFTATGAPNAAAALQDSDDGTYCVHRSATLPIDMLIGGIAYGDLYAEGRVISLCPLVRSKQPGARTVRACISVLDQQDGSIREGVALALPAKKNSIAEYKIEPHKGQMLMPGVGGAWFEGRQAPYYVDQRAVLTFYDPHTAVGNRATWYKALVFLCWLRHATVAAPSAPTGTVTASQRPTCTAKVSAVVESWQFPLDRSEFLTGVTVEWAICEGTLVTPSATPLLRWTSQHAVDQYIDGSTASQVDCSSQPPEPLPNGALTLFARVSREHPSGVPRWSAYAYRQFTQNVSLPSTPTLAAAADDAGQRMVLSYRANATVGYDTGSGRAQVQRLVGAEWQDVQGLADIPVTLNTNLTFHEYEAPRGVKSRWRARVSMELSGDGTRIWSAWAQTADVDGPALSGWNIKFLASPGDNWLGVLVEEESEQSQRERTVLAPLDRPLPIVVSGRTEGASGTLAITAQGATDVERIRSLADHDGVLYLESPYGDARRIALTGLSWDRYGAGGHVLRRASLEYAEVSR